MKRDATEHYEKGAVVETNELENEKLHPNYWAAAGKELIDKEYPRLQRVEEVCAILGISPSRFRDVFYLAYGVKPKTYLDQAKIKKAIELLDSGSEKIIDVAISVGIPGRNTFRVTFKKLTGVTPRSYRKKMSSGENDARK